ncbi:MAG TPA: lytic murein transglycosylase B [Steroidobacteraceae bacterium]|nr:lytic murein transglycosylase B [Steroidobacteraceae bacterium]
MKPVAATIAALMALCLLTTPAPAADYLARADVRAFIESMRDEHGIDVSDLEHILGDVRHEPTVVRLLNPEPSSAPSSARSYTRYRSKFITPNVIAAGTGFWSQHEADFRRAEEEFGVPPEVILGILGVETSYGRNTGSFRALDALATAAFDGARRQSFFRDELKALILLSRERGIDPLVIKGSYAGAVGLPQFMPSSYRKYAVDYDGDGAIDLLGSPADAIGSIAAYIKAFGWVPGETPTAHVRLLPGSETELVSGLARVHDIMEVQGKGVVFRGAEPPAGPCSIFELPTPGEASKYVAGFKNFEAITRYNRSTFYASTVLELGNEIIKAAEREQRSSAGVTAIVAR